ncbi:hypothetical protein APHAL10511_003107 [Amanita phalloides]|nr:hypothetical protein APHAL10511_003107 [Amanita phalloides]
MPHVPQELVDLVVDNIHDDRISLVTASLVCRSWCCATRPHLFRRAVFHINSPLLADDDDISDLDCDLSVPFHRFHLLHQIILERPSLAYHIRHLVLSGATAHKCSPWKQVEPVISSILTRLHRVTSVALRDVHWDHLSPQCQTTLCTIFSNPQLSHVDLYSFNAPLPIVFSLVGSAKNLQSFSTAFTPATNFRQPFDSLATKFAPSRVMLHSLEIGSSPRISELADALLDPKCPVNISNLHHLRMTHVTDIPVCGQLLRATGQSLEILELWAPTSREPRRVGDDISLRFMPALRSFQIKGLLFSPNVCSVPCLCDIYTVDAPHGLEKLELLVDADNSRRMMLNWSSWSALDSVLSSPFFYSLNKVEIKLHFSRPGASTYLGLMALQRAMPRLRQSGILNVCYA